MRILNAEAVGFDEDARGILRSVGTLKEGMLDREGLLDQVAEAEVLIVRLAHRIDEEVLAAGPGLQVIVTATTGLDHIDLEAASARGVVVLSLRGEVEFLESVVATPEHSWALLLALIRNLPAACESVREGGWDRDAYRGRELAGKSLGLVGLGRVGRRVAAYGKVFGMRVAAYDPSPAKWLDGVERFDDLESLLAFSDVLSLHPPLSPETAGMIGADELARLPRGSFLVNTARGALVDEPALAAALRSGHLAGAALDVVCGERDTAHRLRGDLREVLRSSKYNLLVTPHVAGATHESMARTERFMARKLQSWCLIQEGHRALPQEDPESIS